MTIRASQFQLSAFFILAIPLASATADDSLLSEEDVFGEIPAVTFASRMLQGSNQTPVSVTVVDRELIEDAGAQTWVDVFRLVPGFQAYYINNHRFGISYHGIGREFPNHMEVMVDGRSVYEPLLSAVNWGTLGIALSDVEYIEIARGSSAPAHGSNAFTGAVNIVTRKPVRADGLAVNLTGGDLSTRNATLHYENMAANMNYQMTLDYRHNSGFPSVPSGRLEDGEEAIQSNFRGIYTPNLSDVLDLQLGFSHSHIGWGDADHPDEFAPAQLEGSFQSLKWTHVMPSGNEIKIHGYHNLLTGDNFVNLGPVWSLIGLDAETAAFIRQLDPVPDALIDDFAAQFGTDSTVIADLLPLLDHDVIEGFRHIRSERYDIELEQQLQFSNRLRMVWGLGGRVEQVQGEALFGRNDCIDEHAFRLFGQGEWQPSRSLMINAGLMMEDTFVGTLVSPRVSANYFIDPGQTLRAAYARGNRAPSLVEANEFNVGRFDDFVFEAFRQAGDHLGEETLDRYELSYIGFWPETGLSLDIGLFREEVRNGLDDYQIPTDSPTSLFDPYQSVTANSAEWNTNGLELQMSYRPIQGTLLRLHYTHLDLDSRRLDRLGPVPEYRDFDDRMARHSGGILVNQKFGGNWSGSVFLYHQSPVRWADGDSIDSFTRVDAQISYRFPFGDDEGNVRLIAQNLGDTYSEYNDNNLFQTRLYLQVEIKLH